MTKKIIAALLCVCTVFCLFACGKSDSGDANGTDPVKAEISVKNFGKIELELYPDIAPITVQNFVDLANSGFYDGLTFHRIVKGFMIQGGDPQGTGMGGSDKNIRGEFAANGFANPLSHKRGVISMARSRSFDSASSQFFIMHADGDFLDGQYAAFGKVTDGIEVVDEIAAVPTDMNDRPKVEQKIRTIEVIED